ncbi:L-seryl-tRNA(Sec) selenium transferase [Tissierella sp. P1]|uniref:L-seryl-tRNA(Sec) selenium transferase n=1 Tax=Tissierella sp. P1 TaxID=1280483 RepID=UPI000BA16E34|nr:L-seryl-tRNA(Sec) selenium transferase [Tissierella sp. P1]MDU5080599.1 L-seryl-tRNA(Sec) selenium transferase [Bacillota bacterium]OZV13599.1 L-seryl-tRNA(Sec) selenium transferase [Tissierella sp. P1]
MAEKNLFTLIPKVDEILDKNSIKELLNYIPRKTVLDSIRTEIEEIRGKIKGKILSEEEIINEIENIDFKIKKRADEKNTYRLKRVVNATGVVIHTNLGRSLINEKIMDNVKEIAINYSNLEYDLETGSRGSRYSHLEEIIAEITGGEAAMVVNNNAAAVILVLSTMAKDKEVIVSRGELVEIGGSFRIPDVMEQSGASLVSVGTTNKTHLWDFENAINENTGALLKVHTSNYRILGFTSNVDSEELIPLKEKYNLPLIEDLGSGVLIDLSKYGIEYEPTVQESLRKGVDIVTFSGDKLLGGPQVGVIVGKREYIQAMKKNPFTRAFRVDKFTISALEATLRYYLDEGTAVKEIPTLAMLVMCLEEIEKKAIELKSRMDEKSFDDSLEINIEDNFSEVGGGSLPLEKLPTKCIVLTLNNFSTQEFENNLRKFHIPIITRLYKDRVYLDLRTIKEEEFDVIVEGISFALNKVKGV